MFVGDPCSFKKVIFEHQWGDRARAGDVESSQQSLHIHMVSEEGECPVIFALRLGGHSAPNGEHIQHCLVGVGLDSHNRQVGVQAGNQAGDGVGCLHSSVDDDAGKAWKCIALVGKNHSHQHLVSIAGDEHKKTVSKPVEHCV